MQAPKNIQAHPGFSQADFEYLRGKGYTNAEILAIWDRDAARGHGPQLHTNKPWTNPGFVSPFVK